MSILLSMFVLWNDQIKSINQSNILMARVNQSTLCAETHVDFCYKAEIYRLHVIGLLTLHDPGDLPWCNITDRTKFRLGSIAYHVM